MLHSLTDFVDVTKTVTHTTRDWFEPALLVMHACMHAFCAGMTCQGHLVVLTRHASSEAIYVSLAKPALRVSCCIRIPQLLLGSLLWGK